MKAKRKTVPGHTIPISVAFGCMLSALVTLIGAAICTQLVSTEKIQEDAIGYCAMATITLAALLGAWMGARKARHQRVLVSTATGAIYYVLLLGTNALAFDGQYTGLGVTALLVIAGCGCVVLLGLRQRRSATPRRHKMGKH